MEESMNSINTKPEEVVRPSKIRKIIMDEHESLRIQMTNIESLIQSKNFAGLKKAVEDFQQNFRSHLAREESILWPILETVDSWGPVRLEKLTQEHREERAQIESLSAWTAPESGSQLLKAVQELILILKADMTLEESEFLTPEILRDDVITVGHFGG